jgi:hypothetical protein
LAVRLAEEEEAVEVEVCRAVRAVVDPADRAVVAPTVVAPTAVAVGD